MTPPLSEFDELMAAVLESTIADTQRVRLALVSLASACLLRRRRLA